MQYKGPIFFNLVLLCFKENAKNYVQTYKAHAKFYKVHKTYLSFKIQKQSMGL